MNFGESKAHFEEAGMGDQTEAIMNFWLQVSQGIEEAPYWRASTNLSPFVQAAPPSWSLLKMEPPAIDVSFTAGGGAQLKY